MRNNYLTALIIKPSFLLVLLFFGTAISVLYGQEYTASEDFRFHFIKAKKAVGMYQFYRVSTPRDMDKIQVRFKIKSLSGVKTSFDPNKFYLVSDQLKIRIQPMDMRYNYAVGWVFKGFGFLTDTQPTGEYPGNFLQYKPEIKNTFSDYEIDGYKDCCSSINFGTRRHPNTVYTYMDHKNLKSCKVDLYFSVPKGLNEFKIYYGSILLAETGLR